MGIRLRGTPARVNWLRIALAVGSFLGAAAAAGWLSRRADADPPLTVTPVSATPSDDEALRGSLGTSPHPR